MCSLGLSIQGVIVFVHKATAFTFLCLNHEVPITSTDKHKSNIKTLLWFTLDKPFCLISWLRASQLLNQAILKPPADLTVPKLAVRVQKGSIPQYLVSCGHKLSSVFHSVTRYPQEPRHTRMHFIQRV